MEINGSQGVGIKRRVCRFQEKTSNSGIMDQELITHKEDRCKRTGGKGTASV